MIILHEFCITIFVLNVAVSFRQNGFLDQIEVFFQKLFKLNRPFHFFHFLVNKGDAMESKTDAMESKTKVVTSYVSHEDVQSAMERFLDHGGEITKIEDPSQEILLRSDMNEDDLNYIDPHAANPSRNGLGQVGNVLRQKVQAELKRA